MTTSFLNILKQKSQAIQATRDQTISNPIVQPPLTTGYQIAKAVQLGQVQTTPVASIPMPEMVQDIKLITSINVVANKNRLDVLFNRKPDQAILDSLKEQGFRFNPTTKAWYHQDNKFNRSYLALFFGAEFMDNDNQNEPDEIEVPFNNSITLSCKVNESEPITYQSESTPTLDRYKDQVNKLSEHYQVDPADLMVLAMDALYTRTFNYN